MGIRKSEQGSNIVKVVLCGRKIHPDVMQRMGLERAESGEGRKRRPVKALVSAAMPRLQSLVTRRMPTSLTARLGGGFSSQHTER